MTDRREVPTPTNKIGGWQLPGALHLEKQPGEKHISGQCLEEQPRAEKSGGLCLAGFKVRDTLKVTRTMTMTSIEIL